jgi:NitT/TauT family transport system permease protein
VAGAVIRRALDVMAVTLVLLASWQVVAMIAGPSVLAPPVAALARLVVLFERPSFLRDLTASARAYGIALVLAMTLGVCSGLAAGTWRVVAETIEPPLHMLVALPKVALYPLILLFFGLGDTAKIAFGVLHGLPPVAILVANAVRNMPRIHLLTARSLRLSSVQTARLVMLPAIAPEILAAFRLCFATCLLGVLVGEMFGSSRGLGHLLMASIGTNDVPTIMAIVVLLFVFAGIGSTLLQLAAKLRK